LRDDRGRCDSHGYKLQASIEAVADELAAAAGLVCGKLNRTPACIVRGFQHEPVRGRTRDLLRPAKTDLFR
jgi:coenzyme F420-0:L-glutamate ligase/coenzyme F420-1:gamma-L-glutamate ligase